MKEGIRYFENNAVDFQNNNFTIINNSSTALDKIESRIGLTDY
jgi:hypothetical protein